MSKANDVVIVTGWSNPGGSTESFINLTNAFNDNGINALMIGPHGYHLDKCNGKTIGKLGRVRKIPNLIWHFAPFQLAVLDEHSVQNTILSSHEMWLRQRQQQEYVFDHYHFVSEAQRDFQINDGLVRPEEKSSIIPNILDPTLEKSDKTHSKKIGGVIGSIDRNKQTHVAIQKALDDGCDMVRVFGADTDIPYHMEWVAPLLKHPQVFWHGVVKNKSKMYASITDVYHYSNSESWGYIKAECQFLDIPFHSNDETPLVLKTEDDIVNSWKKILV